jgi:predicted acyltransferase
MSLDALRGFDMFWIVGGAGILRALEKFSGSPFLSAIRQQLTHVEWAGFRFYDLIFPLFVFIAGVSLTFSTSKAVEKIGKAGAVKRMLSRGLLLFLVGVFYSGGLSQGLDGVRWLGVLNRIALASTAAGILLVFLPVRTLLGVCAGILLGYWALLAWVPIRAIPLTPTAVQEGMARTGTTNVQQLYWSTTQRISGQYEPGLNVVNHFDFEHLPGKKYDTYYDPEGILSTFPAIATCLLGVFAGTLLRQVSLKPSQRTLRLILAGLGCLAVGWVWSGSFPIVKKLWSSSSCYLPADGVSCSWPDFTKWWTDGTNNAGANPLSGSAPTPSPSTCSPVSWDTERWPDGSCLRNYGPDSARRERCFRPPAGCWCSSSSPAPCTAGNSSSDCRTQPPPTARVGPFQGVTESRSSTASRFMRRPCSL